MLQKTLSSTSIIDADGRDASLIPSEILRNETCSNAVLVLRSSVKDADRLLYAHTFRRFM